MYQIKEWAALVVQSGPVVSASCCATARRARTPGVVLIGDLRMHLRRAEASCFLFGSRADFGGHGQVEMTIHDALLVDLLKTHWLFLPMFMSISQETDNREYSTYCSGLPQDIQIQKAPGIHGVYQAR